MNVRTSSLAASALTAFLVAACSSEPQPSHAEIQQSLAAQLPSFARISSFSVEATQNMGTRVEPVWHARFRATVTVGAPTFAADGADSNVIFLRVVKNAGDSIEMFGKSVSSLYAGTWRTSAELDGQPLVALGLPEGAFAPRRTVIRGSEAERVYLAEIAEMQRVEEQKAIETAAAARAAQSPTKVISKYRYIAYYADPYLFVGSHPRSPVYGTITLTDVGIELSGEQPKGSAMALSAGFFESFAADKRYKDSGQYTNTDRVTTLRRANYVGLSDFRVVWNAFWRHDHNTPLVLAGLQERDRFFVDLTKAMQEWAGKYARFAVTQLNVDQRCLVNTYLVTCSEPTPFVVK